VTLPVAGMQDSPAQRYAGTITYGKRYVLAALLGITIEDDVDGQQPGDASEVVNAAEFDELTKLIADTGADTRRFCTYLGVASLRALPSYRFTEARRALQAKGAKPDA
jgi:hypothetical protein